MPTLITHLHLFFFCIYRWLQTCMCIYDHHFPRTRYRCFPLTNLRRTTEKKMCMCAARSHLFFHHRPTCVAVRSNLKGIRSIAAPNCISTIDRTNCVNGPALSTVNQLSEWNAIEKAARFRGLDMMQRWNLRPLPNPAFRLLVPHSRLVIKAGVHYFRFLILIGV